MIDRFRLEALIDSRADTSAFEEAIRAIEALNKELEELDEKEGSPES